LTDGGHTPRTMVITHRPNDQQGWYQATGHERAAANPFAGGFVKHNYEMFDV
jgi:hypothetical protein